MSSGFGLDSSKLGRPHGACPPAHPSTKTVHIQARCEHRPTPAQRWDSRPRDNRRWWEGHRRGLWWLLVCCSVHSLARCPKSLGSTPASQQGRRTKVRAS